MGNKPWDDARYQQACAVLAQSRTIDDAARVLRVSPRTLRYAFTRRGAHAGAFLSQSKPVLAPLSDAPPPPDPVEQLAAKRTQAAARAQHSELVQRLADAEERLRFVSDLRARTPIEIPRLEFGRGAREGVAVALLSDAHIEEVVRPEAVSGRNAYNLAISEARMQRFFAGFAWMIRYYREYWAVREALLWLGGDLLTGHIHDELIETNDCHPLEAILALRGRLRSGIRQLLEDDDLERVIIPCNVGNHGRTTSKRRVKTLTENSYEWLLYNVLADDFASDPRVTFEIPRSAHTYMVAKDWRLHFHHGDEVRYWGGVGGLNVPLGKRVPMWDTVKPADIHHIGHFHQFRDYGHTVVNGSVIGYSEYAMAIGAAYEQPAQACYLLDAKRGKTLVTPLWVDDDADPKPEAT